MQNVVFFLLGIVCIYFITEVPDFNPVYYLPLPVISWLLFPAFRWLSSFVLGILWMLVAVQNVHQQQLPPELVGETVTITGTVASLPDSKTHRTCFNFVIDNMQYKGEQISGPKTIRLNWYNKFVNINAGETWQLEVRLKPARGLANPGGFDYERWLFENRITATGYVYGKGQQKLILPAPWYSINHWRQTLRDKVNQHYIDGKHLSLVNALLIGDRSQVSEQQWDVLTATGTNHLLAISGLHIGLIAGLTYWLFQRIFRKAGRLLLYVPAYKLAAMAALFAALTYAALAGFSIPTQRALIMIAVALLFTIINRNLSVSRILAIALLAVLLFDPLAVLSVSFWLSYAAVVIIVFTMQGRWQVKNLWWQYGRLQWVISLAMLPIVLYAFQSFSVVSPLANIFAVPWVSFVVVPLIFLSAALSWLAPVFEVLLQLSDYSLSVLWWVLQTIAEWPLARYFGNISSIELLLFVLFGAFLLIAPRGLPLRVPGLVLFLLIFFTPQEKLEQGNYKLTQLDVGQGLSTVVETRNHVLVYDTGAKFGESFDMGKAVIAPFLRSRNIRVIDTLIISHGDNDHIGGMDSLRSQFEIRQLLSGVMNETPFDYSQACSSTNKWQWDGVNFEILHPEPDAELSGNNGSCVLKISNAQHSVLLTGDIEKLAEQQLLEKRFADLDVNLLVAPHHGSKTSSTTAFIDAISPQWVLFPAGYSNRFGFPKAEIVDRYVSRGSEVMVTGELGAIAFRFDQNGVVEYSSYRMENAKVWNIQALK